MAMRIGGKARVRQSRLEITGLDFSAIIDTLDRG
jgi:hypothetical protein